MVEDNVLINYESAKEAVNERQKQRSLERVKRKRERRERGPREISQKRGDATAWGAVRDVTGDTRLLGGKKGPRFIRIRISVVI